MRTDATLEQVKILAKQLKVPTFASYPDLVRQMGSDIDFGKLLLALMEGEYEQRQENQNRRRLKQAGLPYTKTIEELDLSRYDGKLTELFINDLASCRFIREKKNLIRGLLEPDGKPRHRTFQISLEELARHGKVLFQVVTLHGDERTPVVEAEIVISYEKPETEVQDPESADKTGT